MFKRLVTGAAVLALSATGIAMVPTASATTIPPTNPTFTPSSLPTSATPNVTTTFTLTESNNNSWELGVGFGPGFTIPFTTYTSVTPQVTGSEILCSFVDQGVTVSWTNSLVATAVGLSPYKDCSAYNGNNGNVYYTLYASEHLTITGSETVVMELGSGALTTPAAVGDYAYDVYSFEMGYPAGRTLQQSTGTISVTDVVPAPPGAPVVKTAVAGDAKATVSWVAPTDPGTSPITNYRVTSTPGGKTCVVGATARSCDVTGLANGTSYTFTVQAQNAVNWGASSAASSSVKPVAPSIRIAASRDAKNVKSVIGTGTTTGLVGKKVTPWVKAAGEAKFTAGVARVLDARGAFSWGRTTLVGFSIYFTYADVKSNILVVAARK